MLPVICTPQAFSICIALQLGVELPPFNFKKERNGRKKSSKMIMPFKQLTATMLPLLNVSFPSVILPNLTLSSSQCALNVLS